MQINVATEPSFSRILLEVFQPLIVTAAGAIMEAVTVLVVQLHSKINHMLADHMK